MNLNKTTLSGQIYEILRADILTGNIKLGEKLTLKMLKERFEVSSTPIREALTRLTEVGLVEYYSNIGVNVISLTDRDLVELYRFMGDLDRLAILYSAEWPDRDQIREELKEVLTVTRDIEQKEQLSDSERARWIEYSDRFHLLFYDYCQNSRLTGAAEKLRSQLTIFSNLYESEQEPMRRINAMHEEIAASYLAGEYEEAGTKMKQHLEDSLQYALECLKKMQKH